MTPTHHVDAATGKILCSNCRREVAPDHLFNNFEGLHCGIPYDPRECKVAASNYRRGLQDGRSWHADDIASAVSRLADKVTAS